MKTSKVKTVQPLEPFQGKHGQLFPHLYTFEDGETIKANHKTSGGLPIGTVVEYEIKGTHSQHGNWGKVSKPQQNDFKSGGRTIDNDSILYQVALKGAFELFVKYGHGLPSSDELNAYALEISKKAKHNINILKQS